MLSASSATGPNDGQQPQSTETHDIASAVIGQSGTYVATSGDCSFLVTAQDGQIRNCLALNANNNWKLRKLSADPLNLQQSYTEQQQASGEQQNGMIGQVTEFPNTGLSRSQTAAAGANSS